jgi:hypothetical protein
VVDTVLCTCFTVARATHALRVVPTCVASQLDS